MLTEPPQAQTNPLRFYFILNCGIKHKLMEITAAVKARVDMINT